MKRLISAACILIMLLFACSSALAATIQITTDPVEITAAGHATVSVYVVNDSTVNMQDISISGTGVSGSGTLVNSNGTPVVLAPSEGRRFSIQNVPITQDMLGQQLVYTLSWTENGAAKSKDTAVAIGSANTPSPDMTATCTLSKTTGKEGDKITLTYKMTNPGTVPMTGIQIKDPIAGDKAIVSDVTIEAGQSKTHTYEYTLGKQEAVSQPTITYLVGGEGKSLTLNKQTIAIVDVSLDISVSPGEPSADGVLFTILLKNSGNQTIENIMVTDEQDAAVNTDSFTLQAGQEKPLSYLVKAAALRVVSFTVRGKDAQGQPYEDKTTGYEVKPYVDPNNVSLSLVVLPVEQLNAQGSMKVKLVVQNNSSVDMTNAKITETQLGTIKTYDFLSLGETAEEVVLQVGQPRELEFSLTAEDPSGTERVYHAAKLTAALSATPAPLPSVIPEEPETTPAGGMSNTLVTVLIVLAVLMAIAGIALLVLSIYERKRNNEAMGDDAHPMQKRAPSRRRAGGLKKVIGEKGSAPVQKTAGPDYRQPKTGAPSAVKKDTAPTVQRQPIQPTYRRTTQDIHTDHTGRPPYQHEAPPVQQTDARTYEQQETIHQGRVVKYDPQTGQPYYADEQAAYRRFQPQQQDANDGREAYGQPYAEEAHPHQERPFYAQIQYSEPEEEYETYAEPEPESQIPPSQKPQASSNIRNRVHRVRPIEESDE